MPRLAGFRTSIESAFTIRPRGRERLPCQAGVLFVNLVNNSSEGNKRSYADLMHNNRSAWRRFGKPPRLLVDLPWLNAMFEMVHVDPLPVKLNSLQLQACSLLVCSGAAQSYLAARTYYAMPRQLIYRIGA